MNTCFENLTQFSILRDYRIPTVYAQNTKYSEFQLLIPVKVVCVSSLLYSPPCLRVDIASHVGYTSSESSNGEQKYGV